MSEQPRALQLASEILALGHGGTCSLAASELQRLFHLAEEQHTTIYGLRLSVLNLTHNNEVLTNAVWKACGDDEQVVTDTIESQGTLR